jgi:hypothetical protein
MLSFIRRGLGSALVLVVLLFAAVGSSAGQCCRPMAPDEFVAGVAGNALLRGPWVTASWRRPLARLAVFTLGSLVYERFVDHNGWTLSDVNQRQVSYALAEAAIAGVQRLRKKRAPQRSSGLPSLLATALPGRCYVRTSLDPPPPFLAHVERPCDLQRRR